MTINSRINVPRSGKWSGRGMAAAIVAFALLAAAGCSADSTTESTSADTSAVVETTVATSEVATTEVSTVDTTPTTVAGDFGPATAATGDPVKIGFVSDGPTAIADNPELEVAQATVAFLNEYRGGFGGRPIEIDSCFTQQDAGKATDCGNQMIQDGVVAVFIGQSGVQDAVWQPLHVAKIPTFFGGVSGPAELADTAGTFTFNDPDSTYQVPIKQALDAGLTKVTVILIDVPAALAIFTGRGEDVFKDAGLDLNVVRVPPGTADMTPQLSSVLSDDPGAVYVVGNDTFCIAGFQALQALGYEGPVSAIAPCISDATRAAIPADQLKGIALSASVHVGDTSDLTALFRNVMETYDSKGTVAESSSLLTFTILVAVSEVLADISGDITPESIISTMKAAPDMLLPGGGGLHFRCNGKASPNTPAACVRGTLLGTLNDQGQVGSYQPSTTEPIED